MLSAAGFAAAPLPASAFSSPGVVMPPPADPPLRIEVDPAAPEAVRSAAELFNRGAFFDAHEGWEDHWHRMTGPAKQAMQVLIQIAVALEHDRRRNPVGARRTLERAAGRLLTAGDAATNLYGIDVGRLLRNAQQRLERSHR